MKILHLITGLDIGGAETMLHRLVARMDSTRFASRVVSLVPPGPMGERLRKDGVQVDSLGMRRGVPSPVGLGRLVRILRQWRPYVLQTWLYHADLLGLVAAKTAFPLGGGPKVAWNIRCSFMALEEYRRLTGMTLSACAALSRLPDCVLTNSNEARRFHRELGYHPSRFEVIPNGFDTNAFRPDPAAREAVRAEWGVESDALVVGHAARFDPMKDHRSFVRAAALTAKRIPEAVFVMAGRGVEPANAELVGWMDEAGLDPGRVRLLGERLDMPRVMAGFDLHASSSIGESFPNAVGETMACGVPNVVTDVGDSALLVGDAGLAVKPGDYEAMSEALIRAADAVKEGSDLSVAARSRIKNDYSLGGVATRYEDLYVDLVGSSV